MADMRTVIEPDLLLLPAAMLADVLGEMEAAGRGMAEAADRARAAGGACERIYDGVKATR